MKKLIQDNGRCGLRKYKVEIVFKNGHFVKTVIYTDQIVVIKY